MITSKWNARTVSTSLFFQEANYYDPQEYEKHFNNEIAHRENKAIQRLLYHYLPRDITITDVGCGTGLGRRLLPDYKYIGIDSCKEAIEYCREHYEGEFILADAVRYIKEVDELNPIFLFSINYLPLSVVERYLKKTQQVFLAVHYNMPYKSPISVYSGRKETFETLHPVRKRRDLLRLFRKYGGTTYPLLNEEYYWVTVVKK